MSASVALVEIAHGRSSSAPSDTMAFEDGETDFQRHSVVIERFQHRQDHAIGHYGGDDLNSGEVLVQDPPVLLVELGSPFA